MTKPTRTIIVNGRTIPVYGKLSDDAKKRIIRAIAHYCSESRRSAAVVGGQANTNAGSGPA